MSEQCAECANYKPIVSTYPRTLSNSDIKRLAAWLKFHNHEIELCGPIKCTAKWHIGDSRVFE